MNLRRLPARTVALIAAYALALQGLLAVSGPAVPPALATQLALLCSGDAVSAPAHAPADGPDHAPHCQSMCAALGQGAAGPVPPDAAFAAAVQPAGSVLLSGSDWTPSYADRPSPQLPRGPPRA